MLLFGCWLLAISKKSLGLRDYWRLADIAKG
jgi:hypothetical protein